MVMRRIDYPMGPDGNLAHFVAMGGPCAVIIDRPTDLELAEIAAIATQEVWRIEDKFSRYRGGNIVDRINTARGRKITVDEETALILDFANTLHEMSDGLFDISSGVLRHVWNFDGGSCAPSAESVDALLPDIGWQKANWAPPKLKLPHSMEIDFGGICKEYAVDQAVRLLSEATDSACLVNLGGDLAVTGPLASGRPWKVGIEGRWDTPAKIISLCQGAIATSGDERRFVKKAGVRYSHILNPKTGWPIENTAHSITVAADSCLQAGMICTLAMLQGEGAEAFLEEQDEKSWIRR